MVHLTSVVLCYWLPYLHRSLWIFHYVCSIKILLQCITFGVIRFPVHVHSTSGLRVCSTGFWVKKLFQENAPRKTPYKCKELETGTGDIKATNRRYVVGCGFRGIYLILLLDLFSAAGLLEKMSICCPRMDEAPPFCLFQYMRFISGWFDGGLGSSLSPDVDENIRAPLPPPPSAFYFRVYFPLCSWKVYVPAFR